MSSSLRRGWLSASGFTQICVVSGAVSWTGEGDEAGDLQLWYNESSNVYRISASKTTGGYMLVCKLLMFYSFTSKSALTKSKRYKKKKSKFHFVQYLKQMVPCTEAQE